MKLIVSLAVIGATMAVSAATGAETDFRSQHLAVGLSRSEPAFSVFAVDSLGQGKLDQNPVLAETRAVPGLTLDERFTYKLNGTPIWHIACDEQTLTLRSDYAAGVDAPPLLLALNQKANHATLLGLMQPGGRRMNLPCVLHMPDMGSVRITCNVRDGKLDYDARRRVKPPFVRVAFPPATAEQPHVEYRLEVTAIYPRLAGIEKDPRFDGFRRNYLNVFQVNPRVQMLANNASSDPVAFSVYVYSDMALHAPPLAEGLTCLDLVRMTLDRYLAGAKGYGQIGYGASPSDADIIPWRTPLNSLDTYPSLIVAACNYAQGAQDWRWAEANYDKLAAWAREMMAADKDGNGLIEYPGSGNFGDRPKTDRRPSNWWDTINFGHEDAYANALAYRACRMFSQLAEKLGTVPISVAGRHKNGTVPFGASGYLADADFFRQKADRLKAAYVPTFLNPKTGVLAGWKSGDGQLHDYWFTFVQGTAITWGLVDDKTANAIMDRLLAKFQAVGYTDFSLGLPGNLVPIKKGDYVLENNPPQRTGEPRLDDGSDGFQYYENGGATGCWAYYTIKALYQLGRRDDARRILYPMLAGYAAGQFQGFGENGRSRDWRDWQGGCHGYEGLLVENYHALLAVVDDVEADACKFNRNKRSSNSSSDMLGSQP